MDIDKILDYSKPKRFIFHCVYWIVIWLFFTILYGPKKDIFVLTFLLLPFHAIASYITIYKLIPKYLVSGKFWTFLILFAITIIIAVLFERIIEELFTWFKYRITTPFFNRQIPILFLEISFTAILTSAIKMFKNWYLHLKKTTILEAQNLKSELSQLQFQVNPHFLFNTLNNINSLVFRDSQKTSDSIIMLSEIMRYMLYEANADKVFISSEINYLKNFIELQRLRYVDTNFILFTISGNENGKTIAPMIFIPFVENAFKHGNKKIKSPGIEISINTSESFVNLHVINYIKPVNEIQIEKNHGIGITNVKRRLELIYKNKYELKIQTLNNQYIVNLKIILK